MIRALIPAPWLVIVALLISGAVVLAGLGGFAFGLPGVEDEVYFSYAEWWMYAATIAAIAACVPRLRSVDVGCRRARLATAAQGLITALLAVGCAGIGAFAVNARRAARAAGYVDGSVIPPGSENVIVSTATAAGLALLLVALFGAGAGSALSMVAVVALALVGLVVPEGFPLPVPAQPYQGPWWQPASAAEAAIIFLVGFAVWAVFGGQLRRRSTNQD